MSHGKRPIRAQVKGLLAPLRRRSESRDDAKYQGYAASGIYSDQTYRGYVNLCTQFGKWCEATHGEHTVAKMTPYIQEYVDTLKSPWTQKTTASALRKMYGSDAVGDVHTQARSREDIKRSRTESDYTTTHYSMEKHADDVALMQALGLRRSEYKQLVGGMVTYKAGVPYICGIHGKGGKVRDVRLTAGSEAVIQRIQSTPAGQRVLPNLSEAAPVHAERATYACTLYAELARPIAEVPAEERYYCRGAMSGITYDRRAMEVVSASMGHSRVSVIAENYLWKLGR